MQRVWQVVMACVVGLGLAGSPGVYAHAISDQLSLHGYGNLTAVRSGVQPGGQGGGEQDSHYDASLLGAWRFTDRDRVWLQLAVNRELSGPRVDWLMYDRQLDARTALHLGQVRLPFGLDNTLRDIEALRPTASRPFLYDEDLGMADEAVRGVAVEHEMRLAGQAASLAAFAGGALVPDADRPLPGPVLGGRLRLDTPVPGLRVALSGYHARVTLEPGEPRTGKHAWALSAHWQPARWTWQAEWARGRVGERELQAMYLSASHPLGDTVEAAVRVERVQTDRTQSRQVGNDQRRLVFGLAWAVMPEVGVRLEWQRHHGHALPLLAVQERGGDGSGLRARWSAAVVSVNAMF
jgi:hypothetical protein